MTKLQPILSAVALILALGFWVTYCHDPSVRAGQRLRDSTVTVDAHRQITDRRVAMLAAESLELGGKLRRYVRNDSVARGEIARLRELLITPAAIKDSTPRDTLVAMIHAQEADAARRDTLEAQQDSMVAHRDSALVMLCAPLDEIATARFDKAKLRCRPGSAVQERGDLLTQALGERDSYRRIAIAFQGEANKKFGCTGGPGVVVTIDGHVSAGAGFVCGFRF